VACGGLVGLAAAVGTAAAVGAGALVDAGAALGPHAVSRSTNKTSRRRGMTTS
jgi:hypothetical protein